VMSTNFSHPENTHWGLFLCFFTVSLCCLILVVSVNKLSVLFFFMITRTIYRLSDISSIMFIIEHVIGRMFLSVFVRFLCHILLSHTIENGMLLDILLNISLSVMLLLEVLLSADRGVLVLYTFRYITLS